MKKRLEIQLDKIDWTNDEITFHISAQTHLREKFGITDRYFMASNRVELDSDCWPACWGNKLNVRGVNTGRDNEPISVPLSFFVKILQAITEYNAFEFPDDKHKIVIDGKEIEISDESFKALKDSLRA